MKTIVEGWHFYAKEWFLPESKTWWSITEKMSQEDGNESMLFIDDVHDKSPVLVTDIIPVHIDTSRLVSNPTELCMDIISLVNKNDNASIDVEPFQLLPEHIVLESEMKQHTDRVTELLEWLPRKKRIRHRDWKWSFCSNAKVLYPNGDPTCIWFDLGLTFLKQEMWFDRTFNVLPEIYKEQQAFLKRIYQKIDPNFSIEQHYH